MVLSPRQALAGTIGREGVLDAAPAALLLAAALLLGGGSRSGFLSDAILQLIAVAVLLMTVARWPIAAQDRRPWWELGLCAALVLIPLVQLLPLPPAIWSALAGGDLRTSAFELSQRQPGWAQISLQPIGTWLSLAAILPPLTMFLATVSLGYLERRTLSTVLLAVGVFAAVVGLAQVAQGPNSPLRPFPITNPTEAVGFFANRNHFAALVNVMLPFVTAWTVYLMSPQETDRANASNAGIFDTRMIVSAIAGFTVLVALLAAEAMARSRAGLGLAIVALTACYILTWSGGSGSTRRAAPRTSRGLTSSRLILAAVGLASVMILQFAVYRILDRFETDPLQDARVVFAQRTYDAAVAYMPWGSGLGSFVAVYASRERPQDALVDVFANHAHNDFLELWLETGALGTAVFAAFLIWLAWRTLGAWRSALAGAETIDVWLARAAGVAIVLMLLHSVVDYPLRTGAIMVTFGFACGLLVAPLRPAAVRAPVPERTRAAQPRRDRLPMPPVAARADDVAWPTQPAAKPTAGPASPTKPGAQWTSDAAWPDAWSKPQQPAGPTRRPAPPPRAPDPEEDAE